MACPERWPVYRVERFGYVGLEPFVAVVVKGMSEGNWICSIEWATTVCDRTAPIVEMDQDTICLRCLRPTIHDG